MQSDGIHLPMGPPWLTGSHHPRHPPPAGLAPRQIRLKYTVSYVPLSGPHRNTSSIVPTTATTLHVGGTEYQVPVCAAGDAMCVDVRENSWKVEGAAPPGEGGGGGQDAILRHHFLSL